MELKKYPRCCNKPMHYEAAESMLDDSIYDSYVCLVCGNFIKIVKGQLDEEELDNFKQSYGIEEEN